MKKARKTGFATRLILLVAILMVIANALLGVLLINTSGSAMSTLIRNRMLDISNTAADMLDGDVLEKLEKEDKGTPEYQKINDSLAVFQENIDLEYIYCIRDLGDGNFCFSVDPTVEDPGEFGEPIVYTDALYQASQGTSAVDIEAYVDKWGRFYSSYSPVFDSKGNVAGIVAVDFSAEWYEEQVANQTRVILFCSIATVVLGVVMVIIATSRMRKEMKEISNEIADVAKDIDELTREINPDAVIGDPDIEYKDDIQELSRKIHYAKQSLDLYKENLHSQANNMISSLAPNYHSVYYIDLDKDEGVCYQSSEKINGLDLRQGELFSFSEIIRKYCEEHITEQYKEDFLHFLDPDNIRSQLKNERILTYRYIVSRKGIETYEMVQIARIDHSDDQTVHTIGLGFTDVDMEMRKTMMQRQALSDALAAAETANKAKTVFLSNMSHEIRTPMNAIIGLDTVALNDPATPEVTRTYLEKISASAHHLLKLINDILDMSRIEAGEMVLRREIFSMRSVLDEINVIIGGQCRDRSLIWKPSVIGEIDDCYVGDSIKLTQVLINILGNSVKFTEPGGTVTFTTERISRYDSRSLFRFVLSDTGIGMSPEYLPHLFDSFSQEPTTKYNRQGSTGLGMSIAKSIVDLMDGDIHVESEKNVGTTFTVTLTLTDSEQLTSDAGFIHASEMKVLIVDPDPVTCEYIHTELDHISVPSETITSPEKAIEMIRVGRARREPYHLIMVNWYQGEQAADELIKEIRAEAGDDPILISYTLYHTESIAAEAKAAGADNVLTEPLNATEILSEFKRMQVLHTGANRPATELKGRRILLAEDVDINAEIMQMLLQMREMICERAENGRVAVEMFNASPPGYYAAILMDIRMPEMDGLEATRAIRALDRNDAKEVPVIALTANAFDEDVRRSLQAGMTAHLSKPVEPEALFQTLESLL